MREFFALFNQSLYSPEFYRDLPRRPFAFSLRFFYGVILILALILTVFFSWEVFLVAKVLFHDAAAAVIRTLPEGVVINIEKGRASINQPEPYVVPTPPELAKFFEGNRSYERAPTNVLVVDTGSDPSLSKLLEYDTLFYLSADSVAVVNQTGQMRIEPLSKLPAMTITRSSIAEFWDKAQRFLKWLAPLLILFILGILIVGFSAMLLYLLFGALLVLIVAKIKHVSLSYSQCYRVSLHAAIPGLLLAVIFSFVPRFPISTWVFLSLSIIVQAWINLRKEDPTSPGAVGAPPLSSPSDSPSSTP